VRVNRHDVAPSVCNMCCSSAHECGQSWQVCADHHGPEQRCTHNKFPDRQHAPPGVPAGDAGPSVPPWSLTVSDGRGQGQGQGRGRGRERGQTVAGPGAGGLQGQQRSGRYLRACHAGTGRCSVWWPHAEHSMLPLAGQHLTTSHIH
jgi:hypothetical protein